MRCFLRQLTCVVNLSLLLLLLPSFGAILDTERAKKIALDKVRERFGKSIKVEGADLILNRPIEYEKLHRVELSVREGVPRGAVHIYLKTKRGTRRVSVLLRLKWKCEVIRAVEDIGRGERVYPWQVSLDRIFMDRCPKQDFGNPEELMNYVLLRDLKRGDVLERRFLKREPLIRRGEEVTVIFRRANLEISFTGEALDTGFLGDTVRVKSLNTGKVLRGRVLSEGTVLVR